tara:strand:- start:442 stop:663 length:222 start_codon:yes stop_codon:yes gene_type:complete
MSFLKDKIETIVSEYKDEIIEKIFSDDLQKSIVDALNKNIDIPIITEKTEGKILNAIYESVEDVVKAKMLKQL